MKRSLILLIILMAGLTNTAQDWEVSEDKQQRLAPFAFNDQSVTAGEELYNTNCLSCHGNPGQGNYQQLDPIPGDPATEKIQSNSDGSIYYKIYEGKGLMPSFRNILSPDEIWEIVAYIRSFNNSYEQLVAEVQKLENVRWSEIKILLALNSENKELTATVKGLEEDRWTPVPNTGLMVAAERYFGQLQIDEEKLTDEKGMASFTYPENIKGDTLGQVKLRSMLTDQDLFGRVSIDTTFSIGMLNDAPPLDKERALWNSNKKAPLWLIISYISVVLTVWGFIFYVLFQLRRIYFAGKNESVN